MSSDESLQPSDFAKLRQDYRQRTLDEGDVDPDPIRQFILWFNQAIESGADSPNAMTLATTAADGSPSGRIVLLQGADHAGLTFYTNYLSRKARELDASQRACLVFWWAELERQVRIDGTVTRVSAAESDAYFAKRPPDARIGAAASPQSQVIASRSVLEDRFRQFHKQYPDGNVPRPEHWGGYRVSPTAFEFWQGRPSRLHDRILYTRSDAAWTIQRLSP